MDKTGDNKRYTYQASTRKVNMTYPVGTVCRLKVAMLGNAEGTRGVAYWTYDTGTQFIFPNGNYDGFSKEEQEMFLTKVGHSEDIASYHFTNVIQLSQDFQAGRFRSVWE